MKAVGSLVTLVGRLITPKGEKNSCTARTNTKTKNYNNSENFEELKNKMKNHIIKVQKRRTTKAKSYN